MKKMKKYPIEIIFLSIILAPMHAVSEVIKVTQDEFKESFVENVKVSGEVRAGIMYLSSETTSKPNSIYLALDKEDRHLCVTIRSSDGKYEAKFSKMVDGAVPGATKIELNSRFKEMLESYDNSEIVALVHSKDNCETKIEKILPVSWSQEAKGMIAVYLNSGQYVTRIKLYKESGQTDKIKCDVLNADERVAYDTVCRINNPERYDLSRTRIIRSNFGSFAKPIALPINIALR